MRSITRVWKECWKRIKILEHLLQAGKNSEVRERPPNLLSESPIGVVLFGLGSVYVGLR